MQIRCQEPISGTLMEEGRFSILDTFFFLVGRREVAVFLAAFGASHVR